MGPIKTIDVQNETALLDQVSILGRKTELRQWIKALTLCRSGQGKAIYLTGNEGIGKSALLNTFLDLAQSHYGCCAVSVPCPANASPELLYAQIVKEIVDVFNRFINQSLLEINQVLLPLGLRWMHADLVRVVALMRLQESVDNSRTVAVSELTQVIYSAIPFFKRASRNVKQQIQMLAEILCDPWLTMAVALTNPINPQVQQALSLVEHVLGTPQPQRADITPLILPSPPMGLLANANMDELSTDLSVATVSDGLELVTEQPESEPQRPDLAQLQTTLIDLLNFMNPGLQSRQSAFILAFDQWEELQFSSENNIKAVNDFLAEVIRQTVDQRNSHLMAIVVCRSEAESYAAGGGLYNALRVKYLTAPLAQVAQVKFLREAFKQRDIQAEEPVFTEIIRLCRGNPTWLNMMLRIIDQDFTQNDRKSLDLDTYQERFSMRRPSDMLELLYTRLQVGFVGEEDAFLKALHKVVQQGTQPFKRSTVMEATAYQTDKLPLMARLLDSLVQYGFLIAETDREESVRYRIFTPFVLDYLRDQVRPLEDDIPTPDKVASLRKILPLAIQSGELTKSKTQELLAMASALDNPELLQSVEQTFILAWEDPQTPAASKLGILESLPLIGTANALATLVKALQETDATLRETACVNLLPYASRHKVSISKKVILDAILPLTTDSVPAIQMAAYQFIAMYVGENDARILPTLMAGSKLDNSALQLVCLTGLAQRRLTTPDVLTHYKHLLDTTTDAALLKATLKGLNAFEKTTVTPLLKAYLDKRSPDLLWQDVFMTLLNQDLVQALPWVSKLLAEDTDVDLKLFVLKRLGAKPHSEAERILIQMLQQHPETSFAPELRWVTIRSLGWIGQTQAALSVLEGQESLCQRDEILSHTLQSARTQIAERLITLAPRNEGSVSTRSRSLNNHGASTNTTVIDIPSTLSSEPTVRPPQGAESHKTNPENN